MRRANNMQPMHTPNSDSNVAATAINATRTRFISIAGVTSAAGFRPPGDPRRFMPQDRERASSNYYAALRSEIRVRCITDRVTADESGLSTRPRSEAAAGSPRGREAAIAASQGCLRARIGR